MLRQVGTRFLQLWQRRYEKIRSDVTQPDIVGQSPPSCNSHNRLDVSSHPFTPHQLLSRPGFWSLLGSKEAFGYPMAGIAKRTQEGQGKTAHKHGAEDTLIGVFQNSKTLLEDLR